MTQSEVDPSVAFGQNEALFAYNMARSIDSPTRPDETVELLARDAVRTAIRFEYDADRNIEHLDIEVATQGLIAALEGNFEAEI